MRDRAIRKLESVLGKDCIRIGSEIPEKYFTDHTQERREPEAVIQPSTVEEIVALAKVANEEQIAIVPRGGGSGLRGGAVPSKGSIVLSLEKFNKIIDVDKVNYIAKVQPGVITADLQKTVWEKGLYYPIDSLCSEISTLGGDVAENAHGLHGVRYGELRDYIRRIDVVLPTGELAHTGAVPMKSVSGYDMNKILIGSKGTLGIFTEIVFKLLPRPETKQTLVASFRHLKGAAATASSIVTQLLTPSALEMMDSHFIHFLNEKSKDDQTITLTRDGNALLLIEVDGFERSVNQQLDILKDICQANRALVVLKDFSESQEQQVWNVRKLWAFRVLREQTPVLFLSFFLPTADLEYTIGSLETFLSQISLPATLFGHAGEGNIHLALFSSPNQDFKGAVLSLRQQILEMIRKSGGFVVQEYFIGIPSLSPSQSVLSGLREVFFQFKRKVDPYNILNPDKILI
jgi:FAD/FMN-containing dehydrogenase